MGVKFNPFTGKLELSSASTLQISEDGSLPNGNVIAQIQNGELQNVSEIDAGQYDEQQN
jgi:hypothetical protein